MSQLSLWCFPDTDPRPADIVQPGGYLQQAPFVRTVAMKNTEFVEKGKCEHRNLFIVCRIGIIESAPSL